MRPQIDARGLDVLREPADVVQHSTLIEQQCRGREVGEAWIGGAQNQTRVRIGRMLGGVAEPGSIHRSQTRVWTAPGFRRRSTSVGRSVVHHRYAVNGIRSRRTDTRGPENGFVLIVCGEFDGVVAIGEAIPNLTVSRDDVDGNNVVRSNEVFLYGIVLLLDACLGGLSFHGQSVAEYTVPSARV